MKPTNHFFLFTLLLIIACSANAQQHQKYSFKRPSALLDFFKHTPNRKPLIFAHRGGAAPGLPENCLATFEQTLKTVTPYFEIDPRLTKDSVIVILHDETLDRTTNGKGKLIDHTWAEIQKLRLKDSKGNLTAHRIPTLEETVKWAKGRCILMLDRKNVPLPMLAAKIKAWKATSWLIVSAYDVEEAKYHYSQNNELMIEGFIKSTAVIEAYDKSGIPWKNVIAYVGQPKKKSFYDMIHARGASVMVYTATVLEKEKDPILRKKSYEAIIANGGDFILADDIIELANVLWKTN